MSKPAKRKRLKPKPPARKPRPRWPAEDHRLGTLRPAVIAAGASGSVLQLDERAGTAQGVLRARQTDERTWKTVALGPWRRRDVEALAEEQLLVIGERTRTGITFTVATPN